ncbi:MAG: hypothetical protein J6W80_02760 [Kiritimatiellae bacterium]|nr:hypothetical protein [Kiritimatiellia bacterium]
MKRNWPAVIVAIIAASLATGAPLSPLPVSRAPFEQSAEAVRRPVSLASWPFHPTAGWNLLGEERLTTWAEFRSGDKFVVANGYYGRIHFVGRTGFGKILFYRGGAEEASPTDCEKPDPYGRELLAWLEMRVLDGSTPYTRYMECYTNATIKVDAEAKSVSWSRPCKGSTARYSIAPEGDGMLALEWNAPQRVEFRLYLCGNTTNGIHGVENSTKLFVNRNSETERIEIQFPDGVIEHDAMGASHPTGSNNPAPDYIWRTDAASGRILIDLCGSTINKAPTPNSCIADFWKEDALDVPADPTGNFLANGSFELGLVDWNYWWGGEPWYMVAETGEPLESITDEAKVGEKALRIRCSKTRDKYEALQSAPMLLEPAREHILCAWVKRAKGEQGEANITLKVEPAAKKFHIVTKPDGGEAKMTVMLADDEWHFVELPFVSECGDCKVILDGKGAATVVDGIRVERISRAEAQRHRERECVEGRLETANDDNLLHFGDPIDARLILSGPEGAEGAVRVTLRNFYNETVYLKSFKFKLPNDKTLPLEFDSERLGTGVFVLGTEFVIGDNRYRGRYQRMAVVKPLDGKHATADFYLQLGWYEKSSNGEKLAGYSRDLGIMATNWRTNSRFADTNAPETQLRKKYGFVNRLHTVSSELAGMYPDLCKPGMPCNPKALTNAVPEKVAFIEKAAYEAGMKAAPDDNWWSFYNEEDAEIAPIRYAKTTEERRKACEEWFQYQHACWKGLKKAFDERGMKLMYAPTHGSCNYNQEWRREMMDLFMDVAASHDFRYDFIAIHTYYAIDNSYLGYADRDANTAELLSRMEKFGYGDAPVMFSEGFNILPFFAPRFGAVSSADAYSNGGVPSLNLGWREFLQAGAMARLYVMDLKYWPRVITSHSWQHRLVADAKMSPFMWNMVPNTLGHLLPSPKFLGDAKREGYRAYVFRQGDYGVAAVWTNERQAELGRKKGMALPLKLPDDARFVDLMGNRRAAPPRAADGTMAVPLAPAPLFIVSRDAEGLLQSLRENQDATK